MIKREIYKVNIIYYATDKVIFLFITLVIIHKEREYEVERENWTIS